MKFTIKYELDLSLSYPCIAYTIVFGKKVVCTGSTYADAKKRLIENIKIRFLETEIPEPEEIEIKEAV